MKMKNIYIISIHCCSQQTVLKEEEIQLSQQLSGLTNELAALQTEKEDLIQQCNAKEAEMKALNAEIDILKTKIRVTEESEEKSKKTVEELEVSCKFFFYFSTADLCQIC